MGTIRSLILCVLFLLGMASSTYSVPKVSTTTVSSGQVPTVTNWNTYLNYAENWINTNLLNSGTTFTFAGGDSVLVNGTLVVDSLRVTGFFDLATHILPRATRTYRIGLPTRLLWALHADTVRAAIADFDTIAGTTIFGLTPVLRPASDLTGQVGLPTFRFNSFTGDTVRAQVGALDTLTGTTIADTWNLVPKTDQTGTIGRPSKRYQAANLDTSRANVVASASTTDGIGLRIAGITDTLLTLWGTGATGAVTNITDADVNATTIAQTGTVTLTDNRILRATGAVTLSQVITVSRQNGQARGSFPATWGSPGIPLGAVLGGVSSKGISVPIRPGGGGSSLVGGRFQIIANGNVSIGGAIIAIGDSAASDGGGGGGLVVIVSAGTISGTSAITVAGSAAHATAAARGGGGGYSGEPGGHAGIGGSGGGHGGGYGTSAAAGGAGFISGKAGGYTDATGGGSGGGSIDNAGTGNSGNSGGAGGAGNGILSWYEPKGTILGYSGAVRATVATSGAGSGGGGSNGGGGGGGNAAAEGVAGGVASALGGGGGGGGGNTQTAGNNNGGGGGGSGATDLYVLSSQSVYAGLPGGMGGGGGGAAGAILGGPSTGTQGTGGTGAAGITPFVASMGNGSGGVGGSGGNGSAGTGGVGGVGGNGGGAAGMVVLIAPTVTYSGTVTGRLVIISGVAAWKFIKNAHAN